MCSIKKSVLKKFTKFTGKHLCQSLFFNKVADLRPATLLKKDSGKGAFVKLLRTTCVQNTSGRMLLVLLFNLGKNFKKHGEKV